MHQRIKQTQIKTGLKSNQETKIIKKQHYMELMTI